MGKGELMEKVLDLKTEEEVEKRSWTPEVILGGKDGPPPENWLINMDRDTVFAAREKNSKNPVCQEFEVSFKYKRVVKLIQYSPSGEEVQIAVDSLVFSRLMDLVEVY